MKTAKLSLTLGFGGLLMLLSGAAQAHPLSQHIGGLAAGIIHPLTGWDHLAAMLAIGIWIGQTRRMAFTRLSAACLGALVAGGVLGMNLTVSVEGGLIASLFALGLLIALAARPAPVWAAVAVAVFGGIHGFAHGAEMSVSMASVAYIGGLATTSFGLQVLGLGIVRFAERTSSWSLLRLSGGVLAIACVGLLVA